MPTIKALIRYVLDEGRTVRELEQDSGYRVKFQTFQELSNRAPKQFPKDSKTIWGMAAALRISPGSVVLAYAESLGLPVEVSSSFAARLPENIDEVDVEMQNALIAVARAAARASRARRAGGDELQDGGRGFPASWQVPGEETGVLRNQNGQQRDQRGG